MLSIIKLETAKSGGTQHFSNMTQISDSSWQLKFKKNGIEHQPVASSLSLALEVRNIIYLKANYRPSNLFVKMFSMSDIKKSYKGASKRGTYQVHSRCLADRRYSPRTFRSKHHAKVFKSLWIKAYNEVAELYNVEREQRFLVQIEREFSDLEPCIVTGFDVILWNQCAQKIYGRNIPLFY
ncbi:hypothetical protein L1D14_04110 [Vibrio tubiashii]|uniref:hypothetical protein n=1 Tax=Vibrio tubiashii TaxID=29498 RepID=UPI001EFD7717|nr:hypothetical protein [Vibrio tubiashii]MCG9575415.1 hypothetical protein [Vibrio tubiashii]